PNPDSRVRALQYVPWWGWVFVIVCGAIPVLLIVSGGGGGVIPGSGLAATVGVFAAIACARTVKNPNLRLSVRLRNCILFTAGSWALFLALVASGIAIAEHGRSW